MRTFSARTIQAVWFSFLIAPGAVTPGLLAQSGAAHLARGIQAYEAARYAEAVAELKASREPKLADYTAFYLAASRAEMRDFDQARKDLEPIQKLSLPSPLEARALLLEARTLWETGSAAQAIRLLEARYEELPQPPGDFTLAQAYEAAGEPAKAVSFYRRVYFLYPLSDSAQRAAKALDALKPQIGDGFPAASPDQMLARADQFLAARLYARARAEFTVLRDGPGGAARDTAAVRVGAADFLDKKIDRACAYFKALEVAPGDADAERLFYLSECARKANDEGAMMATIARLQKQYPRSPWRLKAMLSAANRFLLANQPESYEPLYKAGYESFPQDAEAGYWHWKVTWAAYLGRRKDAVALLREQTTRYPESSNVSSALYYLGRLAERNQDFRSARAYYDTITERYPGYYYGILAKARLAEPPVARATSGEQALAFLRTIAFPEKKAPENYTPTTITARRIERSRLLAEAGLTQLAESELRFGARTGAQPHLIAMELARAQEPHAGLRSMKSLVSDYFTLTPDSAPERFWELLFPLPYRGELVRQASASALDPNIVAGLIRQESEFNPRVISRANAYGLTQLVPSTGRELARRAGIRAFNSGMLFQPSMNLRLGTTYLRSLLDQWGGKWEETLASYNAGKSHVLDWVHWGDFQEPAEFVETIPFTETREYVQSVIRNAAAYRRIYGSRMAAVEESAPVKKVAAPVRTTPKKSKRTRLAG